MPHSHLVEVFGFPVDNSSTNAQESRDKKLCPFNNTSERCTKSSKTNPIGACSIWDSGEPVIICPVRFTENQLVARDAANFFGYPEGEWRFVSEVRLNDKDGRSAGNIDMVVVRVDSAGRIVDYGAVEVQSVYISGNVKKPFEHYMGDPRKRHGTTWTETNARPDYLSSSRKRLMPQLVYKGEILRTWDKKIAVAIQKSFFETLPGLPAVSEAEAEVAWLIYDLREDSSSNTYELELYDTVCTKLEPALERIASAKPGAEGDFRKKLKEKLKRVGGAASLTLF